MCFFFFFAGSVPVGLTGCASSYERLAEFPGRILMIGCGAIGGGLLPLVLRHIGVTKNRILVVSANPADEHRVKEQGVTWKHMVLTPANYRELITPLVSKGDLVLNMSACVGSLDIIKLVQDLGCLYVDTSNEPWDDAPETMHLTWGRYSAKGAGFKAAGKPTAVISALLFCVFLCVVGFLPLFRLAQTMA